MKKKGAGQVINRSELIQTSSASSTSRRNT